MFSETMLRPVQVFFNQIRTKVYRSTPKVWKENDGVKYGLVTYFPRHKNEVDPPITPTKLLLVERVEKVKGNPYWHKKILAQMHLDVENRKKQTTVVKNTPEICAMLWQIKHLIKVTPIQLPENLPDNEDSVSTYLHENGKLMVFPKIDEKRYKATEDFINNPKKLDKETIKEQLRREWLER
ncbi:39S ribosomal protein L30, mitochondrial [Copidosoma floridanum]|uniref:39S ribosomal protein L30, mitochondrial n=1 Tax=Copidosoma floridanum TaxID=29053 RepID=UPI0006C9CF9D|nr:39S ribosomal protein L30, mitochondrial [Copidosoma floridanum]